MEADSLYMIKLLGSKIYSGIVYLTIEGIPHLIGVEFNNQFWKYTDIVTEGWQNIPEQ